MFTSTLPKSIHPQFGAQLWPLLVMLVLLAPATQAQTTAFTYQGKLTDAGNPANGNYDLQFKLFDAVSGGAQIGSSLTSTNVSVVAGIFTVTLDFGSAAFSGANRFLEISVRLTGSGSFTTLSPRQAITSTPYAIQSLNAINATNAQLLSGFNFSHFVQFDVNNNVGIGTGLPAGKMEVQDLNGAIAFLGTGASRGIIGRLGVISCAGTYGVGGCAGTTGGAGVLGDSDSGIGVQARSNTGRAVQGFSTSGIGVIGDSTARGVVGTLSGGSCAGTYAVGGCGGTTGDGVLARSGTGPGGASFAALHAYNTASGDLFIGEVGSSASFRVARIDGNGRGYFNGGTQGSGADYADSMPTTDEAARLEPGDVLVIDPQHGYAVRQSRAANSRLVAGVYSTQPSFLGTGKHGLDDSLAGEVPVALVGIVPTKVSAENGPIHIGDLLVTASLPGHAMKARPRVVKGVVIYPTGAILGKALEPLQRGTGVIKVLVTLR
jgi:hypothetical protein